MYEENNLFLVRFLFIYTIILVKPEMHHHLSYMIQFRSIWEVILVLNIPAKLQAKLHDAIQYPWNRTNVQESLGNQGW